MMELKALYLAAAWSVNMTSDLWFMIDPYINNKQAKIIHNYDLDRTDI